MNSKKQKLHDPRSNSQQEQPTKKENPKITKYEKRIKDRTIKSKHLNEAEIAGIARATNQ